MGRLLGYLFIVRRSLRLVPNIEIAPVEIPFFLHVGTHAQDFLIVYQTRKGKTAKAFVLKQFLASGIVPRPRRETVVPTPNRGVDNLPVIRVDTACEQKLGPQLLLLIRAIFGQIIYIDTELRRYGRCERNLIIGHTYFEIQGNVIPYGLDIHRIIISTGAGIPGCLKSQPNHGCGLLGLCFRLKGDQCIVEAVYLPQNAVLYPELLWRARCRKGYFFFGDGGKYKLYMFRLASSQNDPVVFFCREILIIFLQLGTGHYPYISRVCRMQSHSH